MKHVAIIMDGNGRWAQNRMHKRIWGHIRGSHIVSKIVEEADDLGVGSLTLYAFSTENWSRPTDEVSTLFTLLKKFLIKERKRILSNNIRFKVIGDYSKLPEETKNLITGLENDSCENQGLKLNFAFGYGGRKEIIDGVNRWIQDNPGEVIEEADFEKLLLAPESGDVDLLIRTGGDHRISNFLLWQISYAELYFTKTPWPEFTRREFRQILNDVKNRERRFGFVSEAKNLQETQNLAQEQLGQF